AAIASMTTLNKAAAETITRTEHDVHAVTDVTGFGLLGHAPELAFGSNVELRIDATAIPVLDGALDAIRLGCIPGGLLANREFAECIVNVQSQNISDDVRTLLFDPQTAGGLLLSVRAEHADVLVNELRVAG